MGVEATLHHSCVADVCEAGASFRMCNKKKFFYEGDCNARVANRYLSLLNAIEASKLAVDIPSSEALGGRWGGEATHSAERRDQASRYANAPVSHVSLTNAMQAALGGHHMAAGRWGTK